MGYLHIDNLYKTQDILAFKECYALEKIHGTSAHIRWDGEFVHFFSGGEKHESFSSLFDHGELYRLFKEKVESTCFIYGEAYGGKCQGMSKTYGASLKFIAFDVMIGGVWLSVQQAFEFVSAFGLEFVAFAKVLTDIKLLDAERDKPSTQAIRNGIEEPKLREGVVLRPPFEVTTNNGKRIIAKHKRPEFSERMSIPEVDPTKRQIMEDAEAIAFEWVTLMRLNHVIDKLVGEKDMSLTGEVIKAMVEDVLREAKGEIVDDKSVRKAIGARAAKIYKEHICVLA
jgi:RNA ligase